MRTVCNRYVSLGGLVDFAIPRSVASLEMKPSLFRYRVLINGLVLLCVPGCVLTGPMRNGVFPNSEPPTIARRSLGTPLVVQVQAVMPAAGPRQVEGHPFDASKTLTEQDLVAQVLARNPSLEQMTAAWQAAAQRIPQATSWDDPMLTGVIAPSSFGSNAVDPGYRIELSQKIYFPGKLRLKGDQHQGNHEHRRDGHCRQPAENRAAELAGVSRDEPCPESRAQQRAQQDHAYKSNDVSGGRA